MKTNFIGHLHFLFKKKRKKKVFRRSKNTKRKRGCVCRYRTLLYSRRASLGSLLSGSTLFLLTIGSNGSTLSNQNESEIVSVLIRNGGVTGNSTRRASGI